MRLWVAAARFDIDASDGRPSVGKRCLLSRRLSVDLARCISALDFGIRLRDHDYDAISAFSEARSAAVFASVMPLSIRTSCSLVGVEAASPAKYGVAAGAREHKWCCRHG